MIMDLLLRLRQLLVWVVVVQLCQLPTIRGQELAMPQQVLDEIARCGNPIDAHLHLESQWFPPTDAGPLLKEMSASGIEQGIVMGVYGPVDVVGVDPNLGVAGFVQQSQGRLYGMASLNTTHDDWEAVREEELSRMNTFLDMEHFVSVKIAPPHTRLPMNSNIMEDIVRSVSMRTSKRVLSFHVGTTPFCGPFGDFILGQRALCTPEYVDPYYLEDLIVRYPNVTFVLMHGGQDFGGPQDPYSFYNGTNFDHTMDLMGRYNNTILEISAMLAQEDDGTSYRNPLAFENLLKIVQTGNQNRTVYGSDSNQFPGGVSSYLISAVQSLIDAGFTDDQRCHTMVDFPKAVYNISALPLTNDTTATTPPEPSPTAAPVPVATPSPTPPVTTDAPSGSAQVLRKRIVMAILSLVTSSVLL